VEVSATQRSLLRACGCVAALFLAVFVVQVGTDVAGEHVTALFQDYLYNALLFAGAGFCLWRGFAVREERAPWLLIGMGIVAWTAADIVWTAAYADDANAPYPSISDALWLVWYPATIVALVLLLRSRISNFRSSLWLDGLIGALATAAVACVLAYGSLVHEGASGVSAAVLTNLAYPIGDLLLLGLVVAIFGLSGWRPGRAWILLGLGAALNAVADGIYLWQTAEGTYVEGSLLDALWPASTLLIGLAAWQPAKLRSAAAAESARVVIVPFTCGLVSIGLLAYDHFNRLNGLTLTLTSACVLLVLVRTVMVFAENRRMLIRSREEARTDPLTGLRNRRSLMADLEEQLALATPAYPRALVLFDLDGFKEYNDVFGHPAGDGLLVRLGLRLCDAVVGHGHAYRLGGDEFCVLVRPGAAGVEPLVAACVAALTEHGEGFEVTTSHGAVLAPEEVTDPIEALKIADRRMYARKGGRRMSAERQSRDVLLRTLSERQPDLHRHLRDTAELALAVGRELGMDSEQLDELARAAELHDVGKVAIPDVILENAGPLDDSEWSFIRRHTVVGERILLAAPALRTVARLVRSSHERWDGAGYPDGLAAEEIPLGSRVVAVCDAFDAMISDRPYRPRMTEAEAVAELRRGSDSQFDGQVVAAFIAVLEARPSRADASAAA
jgi:two-component system cell cycle response regulator